MGKLSTVTVVLNWLRDAAAITWKYIKIAAVFVATLFGRLRNWLRLHVPFVEAIVQRHIHNPATIFIDIALFILGLYLALGVAGYINVYNRKSESRTAEVLMAMYPMPAAKVDGSFVWSHKFLQRLRFLNTFNAQAPAEVKEKLPSDQELRQQIMAGLVEDQIVLLEATERGVRVTKEELDTAFEEQKKQTENFEGTLKTLYGMTSQEFKQVIAERILKEKLKSVVLLRVKIRHVLTATEGAAREARGRIEGGAAFEDIAKEYSQDTQTKDTGGNLGYWTKGELAAQISSNFEDTAFALGVNELSQPIQSKFGFHIIQVTERNEGELKTYADWYKEVQPNHTVKVYIPY